MKREARPTILATGGTGFLGAHLVRMLGSQNKGRLRVLVHSAPPAWLKAARWTRRSCLVGNVAG